MMRPSKMGGDWETLVYDIVVIRRPRQGYLGVLEQLLVPPPFPPPRAPEIPKIFRQGRGGTGGVPKSPEDP